MKNSRIDNAILGVAKRDWLKVAKVSVDALQIKGVGVPETEQGVRLILEHIKDLVSEGHLIAKGNLNRPRYSEVRLPGHHAVHPVSACVRNLYTLSGAKAFWAKEAGKSESDVPTWADLRPYLKKKPRCPQRGTYTLERVADPPRCTYGRTHTIAL